MSMENLGSKQNPLIIGRCSGCGGDVYSDEEYGFDSDGDFIHNDCEVLA